MKKIYMTLWLIAIIGSTTLGLRACADTVNVSVRTVDQDGKPVAEAKLDSESGDKTISGQDGRAQLAVKKKAFSTRFGAVKEGYYESETDGFPIPLSPNVDLSKTVDIVMKKIKKPIPMYAKNFTAGHRGILKLPSYDGKTYGFDLIIGDWVAPHGKDTTSDLIFQFQGNSGRVLELDKWEKKITVTFSNHLDGIIAWQGLSDNGRAYGSELASDYEAPATGYQAQWIQRTWKEKGGLRQTTENQFRNFYFRVRTQVDEKGNIVSTHYGKIYGDFMSFNYYLNPNPNDRNVEFDTNKNLFHTEKVTKP